MMHCKKWFVSITNTSREDPLSTTRNMQLPQASHAWSFQPLTDNNAYGLCFVTNGQSACLCASMALAVKQSANCIT